MSELCQNAFYVSRGSFCGRKNLKKIYLLNSFRTSKKNVSDNVAKKNWAGLSKLHSSRFQQRLEGKLSIENVQFDTLCRNPAKKNRSVAKNFWHVFQKCILGIKMTFFEEFFIFYKQRFVVFFFQTLSEKFRAFEKQIGQRFKFCFLRAHGIFERNLILKNSWLFSDFVPKTVRLLEDNPARFLKMHSTFQSKSFQGPFFYNFSFQCFFRVLIKKLERFLKSFNSVVRKAFQFSRRTF